MSNILKNSEIKKVIIAVVTLGIIFYCISFLSINLTFNNISKNYAKENIALAGAILEKYPELEDAKDRENAICKELGCVFVMQIGDVLKSGKRHDGRAPDYDDWKLNGDILFWYEPLQSA